MRSPFIGYNTTGAVPYITGTTVKRVNNCNGFVAINTGDTVAFINDQVLYPGVPGTIIGDSLSIGGNAYEIYLGNINIRFTGAGVNPEVTINQKFYTLPNNETII